MNQRLFLVVGVLSVGLILGFSFTVSAEENLIPTWIKNTAGFWVDDQISDIEFINALQFLVKEGILVIPQEQNETEKKTDVSQLTIEELKEQAVSWDYKDILRNEEYYIGKIIYLTGSIEVIKEHDDWGDWVLLEVQTGLLAWDTVFYVWYDGSRLLRDDTIGAYVVVDGVNERETLREGSYIYNPIGTSRHLTCTNC